MLNLNKPTHVFADTVGFFNSAACYWVSTVSIPSIVVYLLYYFNVIQLNWLYFIEGGEGFNGKPIGRSNQIPYFSSIFLNFSLCLNRFIC